LYTGKKETLALKNRKGLITKKKERTFSSEGRGNPCLADFQEESLCDRQETPGKEGRIERSIALRGKKKIGGSSKVEPPSRKKNFICVEIFLEPYCLPYLRRNRSITRDLKGVI